MEKSRVAILVRIRPTLKAKLVELAKSENRSLNQQIEFLLERSISRATEDSTNDPDQARLTRTAGTRKKAPFLRFG